MFTPTLCHMSGVTCHMSGVTGHVSRVRCYVSGVTCFIVFFIQQSSGGQTFVTNTSAPFLCICHEIRKGKFNFFPVYSGISYIIQVTLFSKLCEVRYKWYKWFYFACPTDIISTTLDEHHVKKLVTLKLNEKKSLKEYTWLFWQLPKLTLQPGSHCWNSDKF